MPYWFQMFLLSMCPFSAWFKTNFLRIFQTPIVWVWHKTTLRARSSSATADMLARPARHGLDWLDWHSRVQVCTPLNTSVRLSLFMYHKPALASPMFSVCQHQYVSLWSNSDAISHNNGRSLSSLASHEASGRDYSTLKGDLSEWWLQGCYVTLQGPSTWPQGSPVFRLDSCLPPARAQC